METEFDADIEAAHSPFKSGEVTMTIITGTIFSDILNGTNSNDVIYGLEDSDTLNGGNGDDKLVGEQESLVYSNIAGVITTPAPVTFAGDFLYGGNGTDMLYGDLVNLTFNVQAGAEVSQTFGGPSILAPITVVLGNDSLYGGNGEDLLVGDVDNILLSAKGGSTSVTAPTGNAIGLLQYITLNMGWDTLYGGNGADFLYGDTRVMTLEAFAGTANDPTAGNQSADARIQGIKYFGGKDYLYGGSGNDVLVGDIGTLNLLSQAGTSLGTNDFAISRIRPLTAADTSVLTMGDDHLWGDQGADVLYGDINNMNLTTIGGTLNGGGSAQAQLVGVTFNMGSDELHGGLDNDALYGDIGTLAFFGQGGQSLSAGSSTAFIRPLTFNPDTQPVLFNMGADQLYGDNGDDLLVGDIGTLTITGFGGLVSGSGTDASAQVVSTLFMGNDALYGGNGNDTLVGDIQNLIIFGEGGVVTGSSTEAEAVVGLKLTTGVDSLIGGNGDDIIYGDVALCNISFIGGRNSSTSLAGAVTVEDFALMLSLGSDINIQGNSGNDILYGDISELSISLQGGTNSGSSTDPYAATAAILDSNFMMGNDVLDGGSGNDYLYGDLGTISIVLTSGTGSGTTPFVNNSKIQFGNDTLIGGSGDDVLVGDIADPAQLAGFLNTPLNPVVPILNQIIFGNDTFQFSLGGANGNDIIKDMNGGATSTTTCTVTNVMDTLKFTNVRDVGTAGLDASDVDAASTFSNSGGSLLMSFTGGSILFENIAYTGQTSVLHITPNVVVV